MGGILQKGYSLGDLSRALGEKRSVIRCWMEQGLFGRKVQAETRVSEAAVRRFLVHHASRYDLARVDGFLSVSLLFGPCESPSLAHRGPLQRLQGGRGGPRFPYQPEGNKGEITLIGTAGEG